MTDAPRDLRYEASDADKYQKLIKDSLSPFKGANFKDVFIYSACYGYSNGLIKEFSKPVPRIPLSAFNEDELWILRSLKISQEEDLKVLADEKSIFDVAELYANGALNDVYMEVFGGKPGEPYKRIVGELLE